ncbi:hypothetical protein OEV98_02235 [Caldibacillus lycopersici]|uniref:MerR family transcriptional regulator n=1 Tax=Perspicuibacillus lycopersici TaxID=1325689 RepID=A0AAE3IPV2_9BACI|nr:hypothetical protein [Perspicuibacillus lycopersici]MCU9612380.1 hypothetical protein [Perspicuibacillus lycopersici]
MFWKISGFTDELKRIVGEEISSKTINKWFHSLEKEGIHYINRTEETKEKVYDELDLQIALFIKGKRKENWLLAAIFQEIKEKFPVRPFPEKLVDNLSNHVNPSIFQEKLIKELSSAFQEVAATQLEILKNNFENQIQRQLPYPKSIEEDREKKFQEMVLRKRIEYGLELEALKFWNGKPTTERLKRIGWFRKEEDIAKRDAFVREYVFTHFENRLRKELLEVEKREKDYENR